MLKEIICKLFFKLEKNERHFPFGLRFLEPLYFQVFFFRQNFELQIVKNLAVSICILILGFTLLFTGDEKVHSFKAAVTFTIAYQNFTAERKQNWA